MNMIRAAGITTLALLSTSLFAQNVTLRYHFVPGTVIKQKMTMDMSLSGITKGGPSKFSTTMLVTQRVTAVSKNGDGTIKVSSDSTKMTVNGKTMPSQKKADISTMVMSATGVPKSMTGAGSQMMGLGGASPTQVQTPLPAGPVHVGSTWNSTVAGMMGVNMTVHNKVISIGKENGRTVAQIQSSGVGNMNSNGQATQGLPMTGKVSMSMVYKFDATRGTIESSSATVQMQMHMNSGGRPMDMNGSGKLSTQLLSIGKG